MVSFQLSAWCACLEKVLHLGKALFANRRGTQAFAHPQLSTPNSLLNSIDQMQPVISVNKFWQIGDRVK
jgi:hypothetical protein